MNKVKFSLFALAVIFAASCVKDPVMEESVNQTQTNVAKKIINSSEGAVDGKLILYVNEETADAFMNAETATRSGIESFDAVAMELGAEAIEPVFNMNINGDEKRAQNLHRWFVVTFDSEADVEQVAEKYASVAGVNRVQYATELARPDVKVFPVDAPISTARFPLTLIEKASSAASSFVPPRLTYLNTCFISTLCSTASFIF